MSPREPERRGGSVAFRVPEFKAVHAELAAARDHLRLAP